MSACAITGLQSQKEARNEDLFGGYPAKGTLWIYNYKMGTRELFLSVFPDSERVTVSGVTPFSSQNCTEIMGPPCKTD
jgi:hypothetical protein